MARVDWKRAYTISNDIAILTVCCAIIRYSSFAVDWNYSVQMNVYVEHAIFVHHIGYCHTSPTGPGRAHYLVLSFFVSLPDLHKNTTNAYRTQRTISNHCRLTWCCMFLMFFSWCRPEWGAHRRFSITDHIFPSTVQGNRKKITNTHL